MLTIVTTLVMAVIGNNVALSLGMVGALSIVRFRTAIKDPRIRSIFSGASPSASAAAYRNTLLRPSAARLSFCSSSFSAEWSATTAIC
jgi:hypothetical protein